MNRQLEQRYSSNLIVVLIAVSSIRTKSFLESVAAILAVLSWLRHIIIIINTACDLLHSHSFYSIYCPFIRCRNSSVIVKLEGNSCYN